MAEDLFKTQYDLTKKSKLLKFYESNKILIYSLAFALIILFASFSFYFEFKERKKISMSENYLQAKIYLEKKNKEKAIETLKNLIYEDDSTYSTLSLFLIINQNLLSDNKEISDLFDHILKNNDFTKEVRNLLIYKKALFDSNFVDESDLLKSINPLLNKKTLWQPHALLLLGDYFMSKGEYIKAIEFYQKIFSINNLHPDIYNQARTQLTIISNE